MRLEACGDIFEVTDGNLHRYDATTKQLTTVKTDIGISNGQSWDVKAGKYYYIDSVAFNVKQFDYDVNTGDISESILYSIYLILNVFSASPRQRKGSH